MPAASAMGHTPNRVQAECDDLVDEPGRVLLVAQLAEGSHKGF
jgi:hypothetical protein